MRFGLCSASHKLCTFWEEKQTNEIDVMKKKLKSEERRHKAETNNTQYSTQHEVVMHLSPSKHFLTC